MFNIFWLRMPQSEDDKKREADAQDDAGKKADADTDADRGLAVVVGAFLG